MKYILLPLIPILWLIGGQFWKLARRVLLPVVASIYAYLSRKKDDKRKWLPVTILSFIAVLSAGYGTDSIIKRLCFGNETLTRIFMAVLISSLFVCYLFLNHGKLILIPIIYALNLIAWQVRAGSLCKIGKYDLLIEDLCRSFAFSISLVLVV